MKKMRWKVMAWGKQTRARALLFGDRVSGLGWYAVREPVNRCAVCGRVSRVLWWYVGKHDWCFPRK